MWSTTVQTAVPVKIPVTMMLLAIVGFLALPFSLDHAANSILTGQYGAPDVLIVVHILVICLLLPAIMGVFYQLGPVAFVSQVRHANWKFGQAVSYPAVAIVFIICWIGLGTWGWLPLAICGSLLVLNLLVFVWTAICTIRDRTSESPSTWFVYAVLVHLLLLLTAGLTMAWCYAYFVSIPEMAWIRFHALSGGYGVFLQMAIGFGYKLLPMFNLSHVELKNAPKWVWTLLNGGLLLEDVGLFTDIKNISLIGVLLLFGSIVLFLYDVWRIVRARIRRKIEWPMRGVLVAWLWILVGSACLVLCQLNAIRGGRAAESVFVMVGLAGLTQMVVGYFYKIIPFLIWTARYGKRGATSNTPVLNKAIRVRRVQTFVWMFNLSVALILASIVFAFQTAFILGTVGLFVSAVICAVEWQRILSPKGVFPVSTD